MKILIVEDDDTCAVLLRETLAPYGEATTVTNGRDAIDAFVDAMKHGQPFDLICLDIMMPEIDGHEVLKEIRAIEEIHGVEEDAAVKIVMTTALSNQSAVSEAFKAHCDAYIIKPIMKQKLLDQLQFLGLTS